MKKYESFNRLFKKDPQLLVGRWCHINECGWTDLTPGKLYEIVNASVYGVKVIDDCNNHREINCSRSGILSLCPKGREVIPLTQEEIKSIGTKLRTTLPQFEDLAEEARGLGFCCWTAIYYNISSTSNTEILI